MTKCRLIARYVAIYALAYGVFLFGTVLRGASL